MKFIPTFLLTSFFLSLAPGAFLRAAQVSPSIAEAPLQETLSAGTEYAFAFHVRGVEKAALINNKEWHYFEKSGEAFTQKITLKPGTLTLNIECSRNGTNSFRRALSYTVK